MGLFSHIHCKGAKIAFKSDCQKPPLWRKRGLACNSWLSFSFWKRNNGDHLDSWLELDGWTKWTVHICPKRNSLIYLGPTISAKTFSNCLVCVFPPHCLQYNEHGWMHLRNFRGLVRTRVLKSRWLDAYQNLLCSIQTCRTWGTEETTFLVGFQAFPVRPWLTWEVFLWVLALIHQNFVTPAYKDIFHKPYTQFISIGLGRGYVSNLHVQTKKSTM